MLDEKDFSLFCAGGYRFEDTVAPIVNFHDIDPLVIAMLTP